MERASELGRETKGVIHGLAMTKQLLCLLACAASALAAPMPRRHAQGLALNTSTTLCASPFSTFALGTLVPVLTPALRLLCFDSSSFTKLVHNSSTHHNTSDYRACCTQCRWAPCATTSPTGASGRRTPRTTPTRGTSQVRPCCCCRVCCSSSCAQRPQMHHGGTYRMGSDTTEAHTTASSRLLPRGAAARTQSSARPTVRLARPAPARPAASRAASSVSGCGVANLRPGEQNMFAAPPPWARAAARGQICSRGCGHARACACVKTPPPPCVLPFSSTSWNRRWPS